MTPLSFVNPLQGTHSDRNFSSGNTLPLVARPWGLHHWTLQTADPAWLFHPDHAKLWAIRLTHQPSPWIGDYGSVMIFPYGGENTDKAAARASGYQVGASAIHPHYLKVDLLRYGITLEMSPTERGAIFVFEFHHDFPPRLGFFCEGNHEFHWSGGSRQARGISRQNSGAVPPGFGLHWVAELSEVPVKMGKTSDGNYLEFSPSLRRLEMRIAASFISDEVAHHSLKRELAGRGLPEIAEEGAQIWNALLNRISIASASEEQSKTFYSCLYRCLLFPRLLTEYDPQGRECHYSPYDGHIHDGHLYTDNGFWDTYRTLYPLLTLVYPDMLQKIMEGWLQACRQSQWTPKWPSPGPRDAMIGTHFDSVAADIIMKGVVEWDVDEVFHYLWRDSNVVSEQGCYGRQNLEDYLRLGYVPSERAGHSVSATLDYAYDDFCVAQVAKFLGREKEERILRQRALSYRNVFDPKVGFMRGRKANGEWDVFREFSWGGPYVEGGPWQHVFNVPHDPEGLAHLLGGPEKLGHKLDRMLSLPPRFETGGYEEEIHEMTEMAFQPFGQYAHSNQPAHHFLFFYHYAHAPEKLTYWVKRVASELYNSGLSGLPGDEDNGEMSAWYVLVTLGLFPFCPGKPEYVQFQPLVSSARIEVPGREAIILGGMPPQAQTRIISHASLWNSK